MSSTSHLSWRMGIGLACVFVIGFAGRANADPKPLPKEEQVKLDKAIEKGIAYLKRTQAYEGNWPKLEMVLPMWWSGYVVGQSLLPAYALLEAGVPANDPVIQKAAGFIRSEALKSDRTYEIALGVLFFDSLGDPKDKKRIQTLALRLVAGQHRTGGWNYRCPVFQEREESNLLKLLEDLAKRPESGKSRDAKSINRLRIPNQLKLLTVFQDPKQLRMLEPPSSDFSRHSQLFLGTTDNSNSQFAMLALWVAQRHGIPVEPTFRIMVKRFEKTQRKDGWWPYDIRFDSRAIVNPSGSMICVGLIGLAVGRVLIPESSKESSVEAENERVLNGLVALYQEIGVPTGQMDKPIPSTKRHFLLYFLWSVERVAMLYNLPTLGDKDWNRWGAEILVGSQKAGGEWDFECGPVVSTSFALLFLKHSHPMKELTPKLPFTGKKLNEGIARRTFVEGTLDRPTVSPGERTSQTTTPPDDKKKPDR